MTPHPFYAIANPEAPQVPTPPSAELAKFRLRLIEEEFKEVQRELRQLALEASLGSPMEKQLGTLARLLKELADLRVVADGTAFAFGLDAEAAYDAVQEANMSKLLPDGSALRRADGKLLKGPNYREADMTQFVHSRDAEYDEELHCPSAPCPHGCVGGCYYLER